MRRLWGPADGAILALRVAIGVTVAAILLAGAGLAYGLVRYLGPARDEAAGLVPADASIYATAFLDPSSDQKSALRDLLAHFPDAGSFDEAERFVDELLTDAFRSAGLTYTQDVKPWVGAQVASFISSIGPEGPEGAALIATDDEAATLAAVEKNRSFEADSVTQTFYRGHDYTVDADDDSATGMLEGFLVGGTEAGFRAAVDAVEDGSLADSERYRDATEGLVEDRLALFYLDAVPLFNSLQAVAGGPPGLLSNPFLAQTGALALVAYVRSDALVLETSTAFPGPGSGGPPRTGLLPVLPADAWAALGIQDVGATLQRLIVAFDQAGIPGFNSELLRRQLLAETGIDLQADLLDWMGDAGLFLEGAQASDLGGGVVIASKDAQTSARAVKKLYALLIKERLPVRRTDIGDADEGFVLKVPGSPDPLNVVSAADRVVIAFGGDRARSIIQGGPVLASTTGFQDALDALGEGYVASGYVDLQGAIRFFEGLAGTPDPFYAQDVKPNLEPLDHIVFGSKLDGDRLVQRLVLGVR